MDINVNEVITLENNLKYLVLADILNNGIKYYYLIEVSEDSDDIKDNVKIMKENKMNNNIFLKVVDNEDELVTVSKLLSKKLEENNLENE